ncbi:MAG: Abi family protein, partial [Bacteroides sp.]|nr:Abi family protein [Bacteroides sp.]
VNPSPTNRVCYILSIILYLLQVINPQNTFASRIKFLLMEFPQIDISAMGFPKDWETELLWN